MNADWRASIWMVMGGEDWVIYFPARVGDCGADIFQLKVGEFIDDLRGGEAGFEEVEHVGDSDAHAADAGTATALP